jgi:hypothetical protein
MLIHLEFMRLQIMIPRVSYCTALLGLLMAFLAPFSLAQARGDIVRIGDSARDQDYYQSYWQNLREKERQTPRNAPSTPIPSSQATRPLPNNQTILKNLRVRDLRLIYRDPPNRRFRQHITTQFFSSINSDQFGYLSTGHYPDSIYTNGWRLHRPHVSIGAIAGTLTNLNTFPVTVLGVNFKIVDAFGDLIQTGTVYPEPTMVGSRQSVTFQKILEPLAFKKGYEVKLMEPAFILDQ